MGTLLSSPLVLRIGALGLKLRGLGDAGVQDPCGDMAWGLVTDALGGSGS